MAPTYHERFENFDEDAHNWLGNILWARTERYKEIILRIESIHYGLSVWEKWWVQSARTPYESILFSLQWSESIHILESRNQRVHEKSCLSKKRGTKFHLFREQTKIVVVNCKNRPTIKVSHSHHLDRRTSLSLSNWIFINIANRQEKKTIWTYLMIV